MLTFTAPLAGDFLGITQDVFRVILALAFIFTGVTHFTQLGEDLVRMMPDWVPLPMITMMGMGLVQILGGIGLFIPGLISVAAVLLILFLIAAFPANVHAAQHRVPFRGIGPIPLWVRAPIQVVLAALLIWIAFF